MRFIPTDLGREHQPHPLVEPLPLLGHCLPWAALGQTCLLSGMERAFKEMEGWRGEEALHLYKVSGTIQACRLWQMEAIKGRGLAGAQLTTSGAGEEGDTDQDPRLYREGTSELQGGGGLAICSAVCRGSPGQSVSLSFHLSFGCIDLAFALKRELELVLQWPRSRRWR